MSADRRSDKIWVVIGGITGILGLLVAIFVPLAVRWVDQQQSAKHLEASVVQSSKLIGAEAEGLRKNLKITYLGEDISNISLIRVRFHNLGRSIKKN